MVEPSVNNQFSRWWVWLALGLGLAVAAGLVFWGLRYPDASHEASSELIKSGLQLGVIVIGGGVITTALKHLEVERDYRRKLFEAEQDRQRKLNDYRIAILRTTITSYNEVKAVRRLLRAQGFRLQQSPPSNQPESPPPISKEKAQLFHDLLSRLNKQQLVMEALKREVKSHETLFESHTNISAKLNTIERYLSKVVTDWERWGSSVTEGASFSVISDMTDLQDFLGDSNKAFGSQAAEPIEGIESAIGAQLLSASVAPPEILKLN